jgi:hypothetical protein
LRFQGGFVCCVAAAIVRKGACKGALCAGLRSVERLRGLKLGYFRQQAVQQGFFVVSFACTPDAGRL